MDDHEQGDAQSTLTPVPPALPAFTVTFPPTLRRFASISIAALTAACGGDGTSPGEPTPEPEPPANETVWRSVSLAVSHACALTADGTAYCWGVNGSGQLGVGVVGGEAFAPLRVDTDRRFVSIALSGNRACALTADGETYCWGQSNIGFLNNGTSAVVSVPTRVIGVPAFATIATNAATTCGLAESGAVTCWEDRPIPVPQGLPAFQRLVMGGTNSCGLTAAGEAYCWGGNAHGQLGRLDAQPPAIIGEQLRFRSLSPGTSHMCGATIDGVAHCWGLNQRGQLGLGRISDNERVTPVATSLQFDAMSVGAQNSCGLVGRTAYCWGYSPHGQIGYGDVIDRLTPVPVTGGHEFAMLEVGENGNPDSVVGLPSVTCGVTTAGAIYCWGRNTRGQLGAGPRRIESLNPVRIVEPILLD